MHPLDASKGLRLRSNLHGWPAPISIGAFCRQRKPTPWCLLRTAQWKQSLARAKRSIICWVIALKQHQQRVGISFTQLVLIGQIINGNEVLEAIAGSPFQDPNCGMMVQCLGQWQPHKEALTRSRITMNSTLFQKNLLFKGNVWEAQKGKSHRIYYAYYSAPNSKGTWQQSANKGKTQRQAWKGTGHRPNNRRHRVSRSTGQ